jgi:hypothetical protein
MDHSLVLLNGLHVPLEKLSSIPYFQSWLHFQHLNHLSANVLHDPFIDISYLSVIFEYINHEHNPIYLFLKLDSTKSIYYLIDLLDYLGCLPNDLYNDYELTDWTNLTNRIKNIQKVEYTQLCSPGRPKQPIYHHNSNYCDQRRAAAEMLLRILLHKSVYLNQESFHSVISSALKYLYSHPKIFAGILNIHAKTIIFNAIDCS